MDDLSVTFVTPPNLDLIEISDHLATQTSTTLEMASMYTKNMLDTSPVKSKQTSINAKLNVAGEEIEISLLPQNIPMLLLKIYSFDGWESVNNNWQQILKASGIPTAYESHYRETQSKTPSEKNPEFKLSEFDKAVVSNLSTSNLYIDYVVSQIVIEIFKELNSLATQQTLKSIEKIEADIVRYGLPEGVKPEELKDDDLIEILKNNKESKALVEAIKELSEEYKSYRYELNLKEEFYGNPNNDNVDGIIMPPERAGTALPEDLFLKIEENFYSKINQVVSPPNLHTIAPYIMVQTWQVKESDHDVLRKAFAYLIETKTLLNNTLSRVDQTNNLRASLTISVSDRAREAGVKTLPYTDSITTRAMLWARNYIQRGYQDEPLADELLLVQLLEVFKQKLDDSESDEESFQNMLIIRTIVSLIESIDFAEELEQKEKEKEDKNSIVSKLNDYALTSGIAIGLLQLAAMFFGPEVALLVTLRNGLGRVFLGLMAASYFKVVNDISLRNDLLGIELAKKYRNSENTPRPKDMHEIAKLITQKPSYIYALMAHTADIGFTLATIEIGEIAFKNLGLCIIPKIKGVAPSNLPKIRLNRQLSLSFGVILDTYFLNDAGK